MQHVVVPTDNLSGAHKMWEWKTRDWKRWYIMETLQNAKGPLERL